MKRLSVLVLCLLVAGCVLFPQGAVFRLAFRDMSAKSADAQLQDVLWMFCLGTSRGAHDRWIGTDIDLAEHVVGVCQGRGKINLMTAPPTKD